MNSADPLAHSENIGEVPQELIDHTRKDRDKVDEPRFEVLLETTHRKSLAALIKPCIEHHDPQ